MLVAQPGHLWLDLELADAKVLSTLRCACPRWCFVRTNTREVEHSGSIEGVAGTDSLRGQLRPIIEEATCLQGIMLPWPVNDAPDSRK